MTPENKELIKDLIPGVYAAFGTFPRSKLPFLDPHRQYYCSLSIGWNPTYENAEKTIEVYIVGDFPSDFYGEYL